MRSRVQVAGEVAITQLVTLGDHLLALRAEQSIDELDAGSVLAVLVRDGGVADTVRWGDRSDDLDHLDHPVTVGTFANLQQLEVERHSQVGV